MANPERHNRSRARTAHQNRAYNQPPEENALASASPWQPAAWDEADKNASN